MSYQGPEWAIALVQQLAKYRNNSGIMADLRRGRGKEPVDCITMHRWVCRFVPDGQVGTGKEWAVYTVASQFALNPNAKACDRSLGWSLREVARSGRFSEQGLEARLIRLSRSRTSAQLCKQLPGLLSVLASSRAPISWPLLASDINQWDFDSAKVIRRWMRDFYQPPNNKQEQTAPTTQGAI